MIESFKDNILIVIQKNNNKPSKKIKPCHQILLLLIEKESEQPKIRMIKYIEDDNSPLDIYDTSADIRFTKEVFKFFNKTKTPIIEEKVFPVEDCILADTSNSIESFLRHSRCPLQTGILNQVERVKIRKRFLKLISRSSQLEDILDPMRRREYYYEKEKKKKAEENLQEKRRNIIATKEFRMILEENFKLTKVQPHDEDIFKYLVEKKIETIQPRKFNENSLLLETTDLVLMKKIQRLNLSNVIKYLEYSRCCYQVQMKNMINNMMESDKKQEKLEEENSILKEQLKQNEEIFHCNEKAYSRDFCSERIEHLTEDNLDNVNEGRSVKFIDQSSEPIQKENIIAKKRKQETDEAKEKKRVKRHKQQRERRKRIRDQNKANLKPLQTVPIQTHPVQEIVETPNSQHHTVQTQPTPVTAIDADQASDIADATAAAEYGYTTTSSTPVYYPTTAHTSLEGHLGYEKCLQGYVNGFGLFCWVILKIKCLQNID